MIKKFEKQRHLFSKAICPILFLMLILGSSGCNFLGYGSYVMFGSGERVVKAKYTGLTNKKTLILLNTLAGVEYSYPQSRVSLIMACQQILKGNIENISFCDHEMVENYILRELDWISVPTDVLAQKFGAQRVIYVDMYEFTLQDSDSVGIYQGQVNAEVKVYEVDSKAPNKPVLNYYIELKYPENHPVAASPESKYLVLTGTIKQTAFEICKNFIEYKEKQK